MTHFYVTWLFSLCPCGWRHGGKDYVSFAALVCLHSGEGEQLIYPRHDSFLWNMTNFYTTCSLRHHDCVKTMIACAGDKESNPFKRTVTQSWKLGINIPEPSKANYMSLALNSWQTWFLAATKHGENTTMFAIVCYGPPTNEIRSRTR